MDLDPTSLDLTNLSLSISPEDLISFASSRGRAAEPGIHKR